jgi:hypothetical protein
MASQIVDRRYALSKRLSLPGAAGGLPAWVAKIATGWKWPSVLISRPLRITSR